MRAKVVVSPDADFIDSDGTEYVRLDRFLQSQDRLSKIMAAYDLSDDCFIDKEVK